MASLDADVAASSGLLPVLVAYGAVAAGVVGPRVHFGVVLRECW